MIDWEELARVDLKVCCELRSEKFDHYVKEMYREVVLDPDRDNEEIKAMWLGVCDGNHLMKADFLAFIVNTREKGDYRPINYLDVLRYFNHMSVKELEEAEQIKRHSSKYC